ncbi:epsilon DNA polymerase [Peniophora sp. CONT]|nr:epsilon DNA polymerase [Peniophora sp. CONT]
MSSERQKIIIRVFRKYSHSLGPDEITFLENVLDEYGIADEDAEYSVELVAKEYNRQDDAAMKVTLPVLKRVLDALQHAGTSGEGGAEEGDLDIESHLWFVNAFEMPVWRWSTERGAFERSNIVPNALGSADSRVAATRDRLHIIRQTILRNEHFTPSAVLTRDRAHLLTIRSTKQLLGRAGERFLLFGMLTHSKEGRLCLEDQDGRVELDFTQLDAPSEGLFTEGACVLIEGDYTEDETFAVIAIGHPPCESREAARAIYGHVDFLGKGATTPAEDVAFAKRIESDLSHVTFFIMSDVWLDEPDTLRGLRRVFDNCIENDYIPLVLVMCGNFSRKGIAHGNARDVARYTEGFDMLADLIASYPRITQTTHFVIVPGPADLSANSLLPRRPLLQTATARLKMKVPHLTLGSNPSRIKFFGQEIVIFREDTMARMLRNLVGVKPDVGGEELKRYLVQSILDQSHLAPLTSNIAPVLPDYDHSLRLYPLPTCVVLADKYESYRMTYEGCHVLNPGSFIGHTFQWAAYTPATRESEACVVDIDFED